MRKGYRSVKKVLVTVPHLVLPGGVAIYYYTIRPHLSIGVEYFEIGNKPDERGIFKTIFRLIADYINYYRKLAEGNFSLVHINPSFGLKSVFRDGIFILIAKIYRTPVLVFFHGWDFDCERIIRRYYHILFRFIYGKAEKFIVLANEFEQKLKDMGISSPIHVESTIVEDKIFSDISDRDYCITESRNSITILFLSRIEKKKGIYEAIDAYATLKKKYPNTLLQIAGDGSELETAMTYVQKEKICGVEFLGFVEGTKKMRVFAESDIYILPSYYGEGMPTSVLEAMAASLPVITRPVGGLRDFFEDGRMGYITESLKPSVFTSLMEKLVTNTELREEIGRYNRNYAELRFAASKVASRLENIYESLI